MAYTKKYYLNRVREVNEVYVEQSRHGLSNEYIYRNFIRYRFNISRSTFYNFLTIPYASELRKIEEREKENKRRYPTLF